LFIYLLTNLYEPDEVGFCLSHNVQNAFEQR